MNTLPWLEGSPLTVGTWQRVAWPRQMLSLSVAELLHTAIDISIGDDTWRVPLGISGVIGTSTQIRMWAPPRLLPNSQWTSPIVQDPDGLHVALYGGGPQEDVSARLLVGSDTFTMVGHQGGTPSCREVRFFLAHPFPGLSGALLEITNDTWDDALSITVGSDTVGSSGLPGWRIADVPHPEATPPRGDDD